MEEKWEKLSLDGKRIDNKNRKPKEFVYGSYLYINSYKYEWNGDKSGNKEEVHFIIDENDINIVISKETIGQYTGLKDKNNVEIYEGDILELDDNETGVVEWHDACFYVRYIQDGFYKVFYEYGSLIGAIEENLVVKVIGNIHDNPELLKSTNKENKTC